MKSQQKIIGGFDLLKFLMALIIVNIHANLKDVVSGTVFLNLWEYVNSLAVPVFFVLSSYFLFKKIREVEKRAGFKLIFHYEERLIKLYSFWIITLMPAILVFWHPEYLSSSFMVIPLFIKNFFLGYQFGASWFFGALIVGVPIIYIISYAVNEKIALVISFIIYVYLYMDIDEKIFFQIYEKYIRTPVLSFPAGLLWISLGALLSNPKVITVRKRLNQVMVIMGGGVSVLVGTYFCSCDFIFRIISVLFIIEGFSRYNIADLKSCRNMRIFSTHLFCMHFSLVAFLQHFIGEHEVIITLLVISICFILSLVIQKLEKNKYLSFFRYSM